MVTVPAIPAFKAYLYRSCRRCSGLVLEAPDPRTPVELSDSACLQCGRHRRPGLGATKAERTPEKAALQ